MGKNQLKILKTDEAPVIFYSDLFGSYPVEAGIAYSNNAGEKRKAFPTEYGLFFKISVPKSETELARYAVDNVVLDILEKHTREICGETPRNIFLERGWNATSLSSSKSDIPYITINYEPKYMETGVHLGVTLNFTSTPLIDAARHLFLHSISRGHLETKLNEVYEKLYPKSH